MRGSMVYASTAHLASVYNICTVPTPGVGYPVHMCIIHKLLLIKIDVYDLRQSLNLESTTSEMCTLCLCSLFIAPSPSHA